MKIKDVPVLALGPGSQPGETDGAGLQYIDMPRGMARYQAPSIPDPDEVASLTGARAAMDWLQGALDGWNGSPGLADISALDEANRRLVNQILGEGEVSLKFSGDFRSQTQEAVLAGVWRTLYLDDEGRVTHDLLEVADAPFIAHLGELGRDRSAGTLAEVDGPEEAANARAILTEIGDQSAGRAPGGEPHVINLSLLPVSEADLSLLDAALGRGPVELLSRGYGSCVVSSTRVPDVWWVRYYNSMNTLILNSIEVTDLPRVVQAAPEDIGDSADRLGALLEAYWTDLH